MGLQDKPPAHNVIAASVPLACLNFRKAGVTQTVPHTPLPQTSWTKSQRRFMQFYANSLSTNGTWLHWGPPVSTISQHEDMDHLMSLVRSGLETTQFRRHRALALLSRVLQPSWAWKK